MLPVSLPLGVLAGGVVAWSASDYTTTHACLVGLGVFVFVEGLLLLLNDRVRSPWDVETFLGADLLGSVPNMSDADARRHHRLLLDAPNGREAEPLLAIYSSARARSQIDSPKAVLVTSTVAEEGRSLVAANLAAAFARHGKRTLLVDCDLRTPSLHHAFDRPNDAGLVAWFTRGATLPDATSPSSDVDLGLVNVAPGLDLLRAGGRSDHPSAIFEHPAFARLLVRLKQDYDQVVVDSPPLGVATDALLVAQNTDEVVFVCRAGRAQRRHVRLYLHALRQTGNQILGVVLNGIRPRRLRRHADDHYYRSYKKDYGTTT
jgi:capsular exopolysaccharide synthesis family protein